MTERRTESHKSKWRMSEWREEKRTCKERERERERKREKGGRSWGESKTERNSGVVGITRDGEGYKSERE